MKARFHKIKFGLSRNELALIAALEECDKAWLLAETLSPVSPVVWNLAVINAQVLILTNASGEARNLLNKTIGAANESPENFDRGVPEF